MESRDLINKHTAEHLRPALTIVELLLSLVLAAAVMLSAMALVNAYGYASSEIYDARPLRSEAIQVHTSVQNWLREARDIIAVSAPTADQLTIDDPGVTESGLTRIFAWMGDRPGLAYDGIVSYDEIEAVVWEYEWDAGGAQEIDKTMLNEMWDDWGSCSGCDSDYNGDGVVDTEDLSLLMSSWSSSNPDFSGTLTRYYYLNDDATQILDSDLNYDYLVANWFTADATSESWSNKVSRFMAEMLTDGTRSSAVDVKITMLNFADIRLDAQAPNGIRVPPDYSIHVTGAPDAYLVAVGF